MFRGREEAALKLAKKLEKKIGKGDVIILALARGGVVIGRIISTYFNLPLDVLVLKKIGDPQNSELAMGVIGPKNTVVWNMDILKFSNLSEEEKDKLKKTKEDERRQREIMFRKGKRLFELKNKTIVLVDDGVATGVTAICARKYLKKEKAKKVILAIPVIASDTLSNINKYFDRVVYLKKTARFFAVGQFYKDFPQVSNEEARKMLL